MDDDILVVSFEEAEVGYRTEMFVTRETALSILAAGEGEKVGVDEGAWVRLQPSSDPARTGRRVYHFHHGERGGHGYVLAREADLRSGLRRVLSAAPDDVRGPEE